MEQNGKGYAPIYSDETSVSSFEDADVGQARPGKPRPLISRFGTWFLHAVLIAAYTTAFLVSMHHNRNNLFWLLDSPASSIGTDSHLEFFGVPIKGPLPGPYTGEPSPELDQAWQDLLQYNNIRIPDDWVHRWGREHEAVKLPDGGYLGMLNVFHELHCIKRLYQTLAPEYYYPNATEEELLVNRNHSKHCLEVLRMGTTCRGDVNVITHMWTDVDAQPLVNMTSSHQCVNFDKVIDYAREHAVDVYKENYVVHPKFGPAFPHGQGIKPFKDIGHNHG